jgi:hypothetical protein
VQKILILFFLAVAISVCLPIDTTVSTGIETPPVKLVQKLNWYKGNTHTHTVKSDGDSTPEEVVRWYREHGYNFLVLTDHNFLTEVNELNSGFGVENKFIVVKGDEVTSRFGDKPIHVNGLNVDRLIGPQIGNSVVEVIQKSVNEIRAARGVPHINHPNFGWAITADELKQVEHNKLFEIFNGHPLTNNQGGGGKPGLEEMWDAILSSGKLLYGIAVDDAHHFKTPWKTTAALPGKGWIMVRTDQLTTAAVLDALERGDFYASTGVRLTDYQVDQTSMTVTIAEAETTKYRVQFIGRNGRILSESITSPAVYRFRGDEIYVRAKVIDSNGRIAWMQPAMVGPK